MTNLYIYVSVFIMAKRIQMTLSAIRKDCKLRIPILIIREIERLAFHPHHYEYLNDFVIDAIKEKLKRKIKKRRMTYYDEHNQHIFSFEEKKD